MNKIIYIAIIIFLIGISVFIEIEQPRQINWKPSFSRIDKIPYGCYVLRETISDIFDSPVRELDKSVYESMKSIKSNGSNYILINSNIELDFESASALLKWIAHGNRAFIASQSFPGELFQDSLNISIGFESKLLNSLVETSDSAISILNFTEPALWKEGGYQFDRKPLFWYFTSFDSARTKVLGNLYDKYPTFLEIEIGSGKLYLCASPFVFTNYGILNNDGETYAYKALSYLPVGNRTYWDEYYKDSPKAAMTPLRYILTEEPLKWAYYTAVAGVILFLFVSVKRRQRAIAVIESPKNSTLEFIDTVANLYLHKSNHKNIVDKKITYFMDFLRRKYGLSAENPGPEFFIALAGKSGLQPHRLAVLFSDINTLKTGVSVSKQQLMRLNENIEEFYKKVEHGAKSRY